MGGLAVVGVDVFRFNDVVVDNHDEECVVVTPIPRGVRVSGRIWEADVAIDVSLGVQDLKDPVHLAAPVDPVSFFFIEGLDGRHEKRQIRSLKDLYCRGKQSIHSRRDLQQWQEVRCGRPGCVIRCVRSGGIKMAMRARWRLRSLGHVCQRCER